MAKCEVLGKKFKRGEEREKVKGVTKEKCGGKKLKEGEVAKCEVLGGELREEKR